ncbi:unnamed protein product [Spodoptera littoralis]|uniref:Uncharacterized protein n=1 Tax=Spodoptera littoralis TaxID=7109 RepID=A0A9P0NC78_SPOLI|nr:unnamed protein product [Spodoptera littoralis]CAH1647594.1 unnamed protein product [Spodoptera littoralis]
MGMTPTAESRPKTQKSILNSRFFIYLNLIINSKSCTSNNSLFLMLRPKSEVVELVIHMYFSDFLTIHNLLIFSFLFSPDSLNQNHECHTIGYGKRNLTIDSFSILGNKKRTHLFPKQLSNTTKKGTFPPTF